MRAPPNGCCPTTEPVDLSFKYKLPTASRRISLALYKNSLKKNVNKLQKTTCFLKKQPRSIQKEWHL